MRSGAVILLTLRLWKNLDVSYHNSFRECSVDQAVGQLHFAEQNIDNSRDVVAFSRSEQVAAIVDNLSDDCSSNRWCCLILPSRNIPGTSTAMSDHVSSHDRTLEEKRCQLDFSDQRRQLDNEFASISNNIQFERDKIVEIMIVLYSVLRQRQCLLDDRVFQRSEHSKRRRLSD